MTQSERIAKRKVPESSVIELMVLSSWEGFNKRPVPTVSIPTISQIIVALLLKGAKRVASTMKAPNISRRFPT